MQSNVVYISSCCLWPGQYHNALLRDTRSLAPWPNNTSDTPSAVLSSAQPLVMSGQTLSEYATEIEALSKLLQYAEAPQEDAIKPSEMSKPTPASIGPKDLLPVKVAAPRALDKNDIWTDEEAQCSNWDDDIDDGREVPEYEFRYKQCVTTEDNFLGLSGKDASSTCCEQLVVAVQLPKATGAAEVDLDVAGSHLRLSSPKYKLSIHLPHQVDSDHGKAKWDNKKKVLTISLPIIREES